MVTVSGYKIRQNKEGGNFISLELTGSLELVQSQNTGKFYATVRRCSIPSTFDEPVAKMLIGTQMEGNVVRIASDPYDYTIKKTGEIISLAYTYAYQPKDSMAHVGEGRITELQAA